MHGAGGMDSIEVPSGALDDTRRTDDVARLRASAELRPGRVGGGVPVPPADQAQPGPWFSTSQYRPSCFIAQTKLLKSTGFWM